MEEVNNELAKIRATQERILYWLDATQAKLDIILAYIDKVESPTYRANEDAKQMVMNIISDLFSNNRLENNNR